MKLRILMVVYLVLFAFGYGAYGQGGASGTILGVCRR